MLVHRRVGIASSLFDAPPFCDVQSPADQPDDLYDDCTAEMYTVATYTAEWFAPDEADDGTGAADTSTIVDALAWANSIGEAESLWNDNDAADVGVYFDDQLATVYIDDAAAYNENFVDIDTANDVISLDFWSWHLTEDGWDDGYAATAPMTDEWVTMPHTDDGLDVVDGEYS